MNQVFGISIDKICFFLSNLVASFRRVLLVDALGEISWLGKPPHHVKVGIIDGYDNCNFSDKKFFQVSLRNKFSCYKLKQLRLLLSPRQNDVILLRWNLSQPGLQISWSCLTMHKKSSFPLRISSVNLQEAAELVTFTEEILYGKLHFLCSVT